MQSLLISILTTTPALRLYFSLCNKMYLGYPILFVWDLHQVYYPIKAEWKQELMVTFIKFTLRLACNKNTITIILKQLLAKTPNNNVKGRNLSRKCWANYCSWISLIQLKQGCEHCFKLFFCYWIPYTNFLDFLFHLMSDPIKMS